MRIREIAAVTAIAMLMSVGTAQADEVVAEPCDNGFTALDGSCVTPESYTETFSIEALWESVANLEAMGRQRQADNLRFRVIPNLDPAVAPLDRISAANTSRGETGPTIYESLFSQLVANGRAL